MTSVSNFACWRTSSGMPSGNRRRSPVSTSLTNQDSSFSPGGQGKRGMKVPAPSVKEMSQRSAMARVLSQASGSSANSARISAGDFR